MSLFPAVGEGIMASLFLGLVSRRKPELRTAFFSALLLILIAVVVLRYGGQEESSYFFWHPYLVFTLVNLTDYAVYRRGCGDGKTIAFEKVILWPVIVIPILSAFVLTVGWLIKLYHRNLLQLFTGLSP